MSRWRESSGVSSGSTIVPPAESSCGNVCESLQKFSKSSIDALRRTAPSRTNGGPYTEANDMWSPPMWSECSGFRACTSNSRGAFATCSSTKSGSSLTRLPSTCWPACANASTASGSRNSIPSSETIRRQPPSSVATASSERIS